MEFEELAEQVMGVIPKLVFVFAIIFILISIVLKIKNKKNKNSIFIFVGGGILMISGLLVKIIKSNVEFSNQNDPRAIMIFIIALGIALIISTVKESEEK